MVKGIGIDIVEIDRIKRVYEKYPTRFKNRIITSKEQEYILSKRNPWPNLAGRFAAKEAVMKSLGAGWGKIGFSEIEVVNNETGKPLVFLSGRAALSAVQMGVSEILISISHDGKYALAQAYAQ
ncbi:holo-ACP synthase [Candidatus Contubernalis alkalaceticus]|nr:holo-ACP synthase [Candidatus Contubernalis alkalaceticus]